MATIEVRNVDALACEVDVLALKYAQQPYGLDEVVRSKLEGAGRQIRLPKPWESWLVGGVFGQTPPDILFVGVPPLRKFRYREIREFARQVFLDLASKAPKTRRIGMTLHGPGYGLDEAEAFEAQVAGIVDAIRDRRAPESLELVIVAERSRDRASRLSRMLAELVPNGILTDAASGSRTTVGSEDRADRLRTAGYASEAKRHVFVAMPFKEEMEDVFHYGIQNATRAAGLLCERADLSTFTGDIVDWVKSRIKTAALVIADLTEANPNVYLEVGYAWGCGVRTVLLVRDASDLKFDVKSQRCLVYKKIRDLEQVLAAELTTLKASADV